MPIDDLTALGQKMREARKNKNRHGDRNAGSFIGYTGSISVPVVFRYDNSFYSKMIQQKLAANHSYNGHSMAENCKSTWHCVLRICHLSCFFCNFFPFYSLL